MQQTEIYSVGKQPPVPDSEVFTIHVKGRKNYEILTKIRDSLEFCDMVPHSERNQFIQQRRNSK
mgnify:CR=1 FL=1